LNREAADHPDAAIRRRTDRLAIPASASRMMRLLDA